MWVIVGRTGKSLKLSCHSEYVDLLCLCGLRPVTVFYTSIPLKLKELWCIDLYLECCKSNVRSWSSDCHKPQDHSVNYIPFANSMCSWICWPFIGGVMFYWVLYNLLWKMDGIKDEDRKRRLRQLEETIQDPRSIANVDCLLVSWRVCRRMIKIFALWNICLHMTSCVICF